MISSNAAQRAGHRSGRAVLCGAAGLLVGAAASQGITAVSPPTEHKGLTVEVLGVIPESSMTATIGLTGHKLQLRAITIEPGGQIAEHSHATRPGLVKVISGEWVEGRPEREDSFDATRADAIIEDESTVHWIFNRGDTPATAIVCDIVPEA